MKRAYFYKHVAPTGLKKFVSDIEFRDRPYQNQVSAWLSEVLDPDSWFAVFCAVFIEHFDIVGETIKSLARNCGGINSEEF